MEDERHALMALHMVPGIGNFLFRQLISHCGCAASVFKMPKGRLQKIPGIGARTAEAIRSTSAWHHAAREFRRAEKDGAEIVMYTDKQYPARLKAIEDAPVMLYAKGTVNLNHPRIVGIVGTRQATAYGKEIVEKTVEDLLPHRALVLSGLAYGIDIHAHKLSLKHRLPTVGVMASGLDIIYPSVHRDIARKMQENGGLLTENKYGTLPEAHHFPARNRIIAGLCDALIVVEAAEKGGALITAEIANTYNKDVFAVPGHVGAAFSQGCNKLIKVSKAHLFTSVKDLEYIMNWDASEPQRPAPDFSGFSADERKVLELLAGKANGTALDTLSWQSSIPLNLLASILLTLEFSGLVSPLPGKRYRLARK